MAEPAKQYDGLERPQVFVPRYKRPHEDDPLWRYCVERHRHRWAGEKKRRRVPDYNFEGRTGWWFPQVWVEEFAAQSRPRAA